MPNLKWPNDAVCKALVEKCLREDWELLDYRKGEKYWVLKRYLRETFSRLVLEDERAQPDARKKILLSNDGDLGVFNTGICDPHYRAIYALLEATRKNDTQEYGIVGFFVNHQADGSEAHKRARKAFGKTFPQRARYYNASQAMFNPGWHWEPAYPHIIYDRLYRFPASYIEKTVNSAETRGLLMDALARAKSADGRGEKEARDGIVDAEIRPLLDAGDKALYNKLHNDLSKAIQVARRRAAFNWGAAMLGYYPKEQKVQHYVPICLEYEEQPDFVLVLGVQRRRDGDKQVGFYAGRTILSLDAAYADTRLVARPVENWIDTAVGDVRQSNNERFLAPRTSVEPDFVNRDAKARLLHDGRYENIQAGDTIGVKRGSDDRYNPDIVLDASYKYISNRHGEFACRNGIWTFTSFGRNGTSLRRGDDLYSLERGVPFELISDDELYFGGHGGNELYSNGLGGGDAREGRGFVFVSALD